MGPEMMQKFRDQAERFGARLVTEQADRVELASEPGGVHSVWVGDTEHRARTVILAMGAEHKKLCVPGEEELAGRGVSYCATCDAAFFRDAQTIIVGGGDSAMEEAIFLSKFASKVTVVHRRDEFRASKIMLERAREQENIELLTPYTVKQFVARRERRAGARHAHERRDRRGARDPGLGCVHRDRPRAAVGPREGADRPRRERLRGDRGPAPRAPTAPGVFAAGDLVDHTYRQAITAAGSGCQAALDAEWYLRDTPEVPTPEGMPMGDLAEAQWAPPAPARSAEPA